MKCYQSDDVRKLLLMATILDPRFKNMMWIDDNERHSVYNTLITDMIQAIDKNGNIVKVKSEKGEFEGQVCEPVIEKPTCKIEEEPVEPETNLKSEDDFFDVLFIKEEKSAMSNELIVKTEVDRYQT